VALAEPHANWSRAGAQRRSALPSIQPEWAGAVPAAPSDEVFNSLRLLGQVLDSYLVAETNEGLAMIDQHAAHERVLLDRLRNRLKAGGLASQLLLIPLNVAMEAGQEAALESLGEQLEELGVELAPFGPGQAQVRAVPKDLAGADWERLLPALLARLADGDVGGLSGVRDEMLALMACHGAVRAGQSLAPAEQSELLRDLRQTPDRLSCPHGRPVLVVLGRREIDSAFQRR
jgi:DNA mismatch repair protein MutL